MAEKLIPLHGPSVDAAAYIGLDSEVSIDSGDHTIIVHDGVKAGGHKAAKASDLEDLLTTQGEQGLDIQSLKDTQVTGVISFSTYSALNSYTPSVPEQRASFKVTNDSDTSLNGYYSWVSGTTYTKAAELVKSVVSASNTSDPVSGKAIYDLDAIHDKYHSLSVQNTSGSLEINTKLRSISVTGTIHLVGNIATYEVNGMSSKSWGGDSTPPPFYYVLYSLSGNTIDVVKSGEVSSLDQKDTALLGTIQGNSTNVKGSALVNGELVINGISKEVPKRQAKYARSLALNPPVINETLRLDYANDSYGKGDKSTSIIEDIISFDDMHTFTRGSTGTYFDALGVMQTAGVNEPRRTHDPLTGEALGLLIEEQRTNLAIQSETFSSPWSGGVVTTSGEQAPSGGNFQLITINGIGSHQQVYSGFDTLSEYTVSCYIKRANTGVVYVGVGSACELTLDLATGTITDTGLSTRSEIINVGNGVFRWAATFTPTNTTHGLRPLFSKGAGGIDAYCWGYQLEKGSSPTSYIPTTASAVTRSADGCSRTLGSEYNANEGSISVTAQSKIGEKIIGLGSVSVFSDSDLQKEYTLIYSADPAATTLDILPSSAGTVKSIKYKGKA